MFNKLKRFIHRIKRLCELIQKGAEFGYNKANEWHDLRNNPNDLPEENSDILFYTEVYEHKSIHLGNRHWGNKWWVTSESFYVGDEVIAWKEIELPELKESE